MASQTPSSSMPSTCTSPTPLPSASSSTSYSTVRYLAPPLSSETASSAPLLGSQTASSSTTSTRWDVFVNFRGKDTRHDYVDYVYRDLKGIPVEVFLDDRELVLGEKIKEKLKEAIRESKIYVVVFSEDYASSTWCLEELAEIYKCHIEKKRPILAVYYKIEPSVVRYQKKSFEESFKIHKARSEPLSFFEKLRKKDRVPSVFTMEDMKEWRRVLEAVAELSGETIPEQRYKSEAETVTAVVNRIENEIISMRIQKVAEHPVGLDYRVQEITEMLKGDCVKIGIYGMGGVGKSTLARAVFNENLPLFERCSFLKNVRESSATEEGKLSLQRQLIRNILKRDTIKVEDRDRAMQLINFNIPSKKVLIVIDDLDNLEQFKLFGESFASGSKIIITTRNEDLLESMGVKEKYKVDELSDDDSGKLFADYTKLGDIIKSDTFTEWRQKILQRAGGLPEALTTFGKELMHREVESDWKYFIHILLDQQSNKIIDKCLMISYNSLKSKDDKLQNIFVDIACSHIGREKKDVVQALDPTSSEFLENRIDVLKKRSLLTISNSYMLGMHILLNRMGRRIQAGNGSN